jgi:hypothetical protein
MQKIFYPIENTTTTLQIYIVMWTAHHSVTPPLPAVFLHAVLSKAEVSLAEARWLLRKSKQLWQRCLATPVNTTSDNRRAM